MNELSNEVKRAIIENEIAAVNQAIYTWVIRRRVAEKCDDTAGAEAAKKQLEILEKKMDAFKEELNALAGAR